MPQEKELLRKQLELLAERSKTACHSELPELAHAMCHLYDLLQKKPLPVGKEYLFYANDQPVPELEVKMQSIADSLPSSDWRLRLLLEDETMTIAHYRRLVNAMAARIRTYAMEEISRAECQWRTRAWKIGIALALAIPVLVTGIVIAVRYWQ